MHPLHSPAHLLQQDITYNSPSGQLESWMADLLPHALNWATEHPRAVDLTRAGMLAGAFSHVVGPQGGGPRSKGEAAAALARGLGAHMMPSVRLEFAQELAG